MDNPNPDTLSPDEIAQLHQLLGRFLPSNTQGPSTGAAASQQSIISPSPALTQPESAPLLRSPHPVPSNASATAPPLNTASSSLAGLGLGYPSSRAIAPYQSTRLGLRDSQPAPPASTPTPPAPSQAPPASSTGIRSAFGVGQGYPSIQRAPAFLGFQSLTSQANQQRLASAATHLVRRPALPVRTQTRRSTRGNAIRPPSLSSGPSFDDCLQRDEYGRPVAIRLRLKLYAPLNDTVSEYFAHRFYLDSFNSHLQSLGLLHDYEMPITTSIFSLINRTVADVESGPFAFRFSNHQGVLEHEDIPMGLLGFVNRGRPRPSDNQIRLRVQPVQSTTTIETLLANPNLYAIPTLCLEDGRFIIHFAILREPLTALYRNIDGSGELRRHSCISLRLYGRFPSDSHDRHQEADDLTSGGENSDSDAGDLDSDAGDLGDLDSDGDSAMVERPRVRRARAISHHSTGLRPRPQPRYFPGVPNANNAREEPRSSQIRQLQTTRIGPASRLRTAIQRESSTPTSTLTRQHSDDSNFTLPPILWFTDWSPPNTTDVISLSELDTSLFEAAVEDDDAPKFELSGQTVAELAEKLRFAVSQAVTRKDFSKILSPAREFKITYIDGEGREHLRSIGRGVEREAVYLAFNTFTRNHGQWFLQRAGEYSSIATTHSLSRPSVTSTRLHNLSILGALVALMLIYGMAPLPLSPVLLHYFIHGCNLNSIHSNLLAEWMPDLHRTIQLWIEADPSSDLAPFEAHFATFHDLQIATLQERDILDHQAFASEMLYRAIVGPERPNHPELQAFLAGFRMPCDNGFDFTKIKTLLQGGSEALINMVWSGSHIRTFEDLKPHIRFGTPVPAVAMQLATALVPHAFTFEQLLQDYLQGSGVPCPTLFEGAKLHFSPIVNLSRISKPSFRSRMFLWAVTGSPSIDITSQGLSVHVCGDTDPNYAYATRREFMIREGKLSCKTCVGQVRFPVSYVERLASATYTAATEPLSFQNAFEHWVLCETLNAIGSHTMI